MARCGKPAKREDVLFFRAMQRAVETPILGNTFPRQVIDYTNTDEREQQFMNRPKLERENKRERGRNDRGDRRHGEAGFQKRAMHPNDYQSSYKEW